MFVFKIASDARQKGSPRYRKRGKKKPILSCNGMLKKGCIDLTKSDHDFKNML